MNSRNHSRKLPPWSQMVLLTPLIAMLAKCAAGPELQRHALPAVTGYTTAALRIEKMLEQILNSFVYINKPARTETGPK